MANLSPERTLARSVLTRSLHVRRGENVTIDTWTHGMPLARELVRECHRLGARPLVLYTDEDGFWSAYDAGMVRLLGQWGTHERAALAQTDVYVYLWGPEDRPRYDRLPEKEREALTAYDTRWYDIAGRAKVRGARIDLALATESAARDLGVDLGPWRTELFAASLVPPATLGRIGERLRLALRRGGPVRIRHSNGTDVTLHLLAREPRLHVADTDRRGSKGRYSFMISIPGGGVHAPMDETRAEGTVVANRPTSLETGTLQGGRWKFHGGVLTEHTFTEGEDGFRRLFASGGKGMDRPGLLAIGFNPAIHDAPRSEDLEMGVISICLGRNVHLGGRNRAKTMLALTLAGADLEVGGRPILRRGRIVRR